MNPINSNPVLSRQLRTARTLAGLTQSELSIGHWDAMS
jgi:hypothetical protein